MVIQLYNYTMEIILCRYIYTHAHSIHTCARTCERTHANTYARKYAHPQKYHAHPQKYHSARTVRALTHVHACIHNYIGYITIMHYTFTVSVSHEEKQIKKKINLKNLIGSVGHHQFYINLSSRPHTHRI